MFEEILARIARRFKEKGLPYMVIGGQAVLLYGEPRLTRDIDITLGIGVDRLDDVLAAADELFLKSLLPDALQFVRRTMVLPVIEQSTGIRVDFIFSFTPYEADAIKRARKVVVKGEEVAFSSPEDLVIHKIFAGRARDIEDARSIVVRNPALDIGYIRGWLKEFEMSAGKPFVHTLDELLKEA
ncbi:MAG: hypothetical protein HY886_00340 [Deltaproteobacteria bacterium]|nr:hypothetical protein [Deltaproteobacteria bacterium]